MYPLPLCSIPLSALHLITLGWYLSQKIREYSGFGALSPPLRQHEKYAFLITCSWDCSWFVFACKIHTYLLNAFKWCKIILLERCHTIDWKPNDNHEHSGKKDLSSKYSVYLRLNLMYNHHPKCNMMFVLLQYKSKLLKQSLVLIMIFF